MTETADSVIVARGLAKVFQIGFSGRKRVAALQGIDLRVRRGQVFGFLGPNGAGKSTTIKLLAALLRPTSGSLEVLGGSPFWAPVRGRYGYLPENPAFHDYLSGREVLHMMAGLLGLGAAEARRRTDELLDRVRLGRASEIHVRRYSKGMVQRLGIAQALLHDPELVILDEPMSGLDPIGRREVKEIVRELRARGRTVFFSTHIIPDVEEICDEVAILLSGKIVRSGAVKDLIEQGAREYEVVAVRIPQAFPVGEGDQLKERSADRSVFVTKDEAAARALVQRLWAAGAQVHALTVRKHSLEDLFMSEVGKGPVGGQVTLD